jgi:putative peptidoglycan lipid II flippase
LNGPPQNATEDSRTTQRRVLKSAAIITLLTFLSRVLGLVREQVRGYYLGTGSSSDAFGLAATIPNLFRRLLAEGAMTAAFIPVFASYRKKGDQIELGRFLSSFLTLFTFITTLVCIAGVFFAEAVVKTFFGSGFGEVPGKVAMTIMLTRVMFPYLLFVSLAAIIQAVLNSFNIFAPSAFTPILLNLLIVLTALLLHDYFPDPSYAFATGFVIGGVVQLLFQLPWFFRLGLRLRFAFNWRHPGVKELFRIFVPGAFAAGIYQINVFVSQMIAASLNEGSIASLQYSIRLQELVLGVFVVSITTVILPTLARQHAAGDKSGFTDTNILALDVLAFVTVPASAGLIVLRRPIIALLFQQGAFDDASTDLTAWAVLFHALGIYFIATSRSLNQTFYSMKDLKTPMLVSAVAMLVNIGGCYTLSIPLAHGGIALSNSLSAMVTAVLLFVLINRKGVDLHVARHVLLLLRLLVASAVMAAAITALMQVWPQPDGKGLQFLRLLALVMAGITGFGAAALITARKELRQLIELVTRRVRH